MGASSYSIRERRSAAVVKVSLRCQTDWNWNPRVKRVFTKTQGLSVVFKRLHLYDEFWLRWVTESLGCRVWEEVFHKEQRSEQSTPLYSRSKREATGKLKNCSWGLLVGVQLIFMSYIIIPRDSFSAPDGINNLQREDSRKRDCWQIPDQCAVKVRRSLGVCICVGACVC